MGARKVPSTWAIRASLLGRSPKDFSSSTDRTLPSIRPPLISRILLALANSQTIRAGAMGSPVVLAMAVVPFSTPSNSL